MVLPFVKVFIERYINLIDTWNYEELFTIAYNELSDNGFDNLLEILQSIGLDNKDFRIQLFLDEFGEAVKQYVDDSNHDSLRLNQFMMYVNRVGLTMPQIESILKQHLTDWTDWVTITVEDLGSLRIHKVTS